MNDDDHNCRVRDLQLRIQEWDSEREQDLQQQRESHHNLRKTLSLSQRVSVIASIPSVVWILCWAAVSSANEPLVNLLIQSGGALVIFGIIVAGAARASGLAAHWWFRRSAVSERLAAVVIALLADSILFGWVIVLIKW